MEKNNVCLRCNGSGAVVDKEDPEKYLQCICAYIKMLKSYLGPEIASADAIPSSPLFDLKTNIDYSLKNIVIVEDWVNILPHLKYLLVHKGVMFRYRVLTDERIKSVFVGAESQSARKGSTRKEEPVYNGLSDIIGGDVSLAIIRLGFLGYKNVAGPGSLKEALMLREGLNLPTWLIVDPSEPFCKSFSWSVEVEAYINRKFEQKRLTEYPPIKTEAGKPAFQVVIETGEEEVVENVKVVEMKSSKYKQKAKNAKGPLG